MERRPSAEDGADKIQQRRNMIRALARGWRLVGAPGHTVDRRRRRGYYTRLKESLLGTEQAAGEHDPWARFSGAMARQAVEEALAVLPDDQLEIVGMAYFEGLTNHAIARRMGISVAMVRRRLRSALSRMSSYLSARGGGTWALAPIVARLLEDRHRPARHVVQFAAGTVLAATVITMAVHVSSIPFTGAPAPRPAIAQQAQTQRSAVMPAAAAPASIAAGNSPADGMAPETSPPAPSPAAIAAVDSLTSGVPVLSGITAVTKQPPSVPLPVPSAPQPPLPKVTLPLT
jgi:RNA polymerase sigma factor (sigma-70 family)